MKRIDDAELLRMLREGKSQKEAAAYFSVSPVAVCRRLKRLLPQPAEVLEKYKLTDQQKRFVVEKAAGRTSVNAILASFNVSSRASAKALGSALLSKPEIQAAISDLMEAKGYGREYRVTRLGQHMQHPDPVVSLKALDIGFKISGDEAEGKRQIMESRTYIVIHIDDDLMDHTPLTPETG